MGEQTGISWTSHTFNPHIGCVRLSPACQNCYAEHSTPVRVHRAKGLELWGPSKTTPRHRTSKDNWKKPLAWDRAAKAAGVRRRVFCASLADVFEEHPDLPAVRADLWPLIERCDGLDWQLLTKRPENIRAMVPPAWLEKWPSFVWIGTTVEDQKRARERIPHLLAVPAPVKFLSCEPLLEDVRLDLLSNETGYPADCECGHGHGFTRCPNYGSIAKGCHYRGCDCPGFKRKAGSWHGISQVIVGGESGHDARAFKVEWARSIVEQCRKAGVAAFVKQLGAVVDSRLPDGEEWPNHSCGIGSVQFMGDGFGNYRVKGLKHPAGADPEEWPRELRVQQFPVSP